MRQGGYDGDMKCTIWEYYHLDILTNFFLLIFGKNKVHLALNKYDHVKGSISLSFSRCRNFFIIIIIFS